MLLLSVCSSARSEDTFLETFGSDQELWDESYVWYRGEEPLYILESNTIPVIFDNEGSFTYYEYVETGRDTYWHLDGDLTVHSTAAIQGGQLYLNQYIRDGRPGENYFHGTNRVDMRKRIYIEAPITGLNHNSRLSMDLFLLDSGRFLQFGGSPWRHAEVSFRLYSPSGTLALGAWQVSDDASGNLIPIGSSMIESFESFDVKINELLGYSEEEFDNKFGNDHSVTLRIEFNSHYEGSWDRWGYEGVYLECEFGNIRIYQPYGPTASFTYSPEKPMVGGNIIFDASSSDDPDGEIVEYEWNWGDGQSEILTHAKTFHLFETPGIYDVNLTVTDNDGLTDSNSRELDLSLKNGDLLLCKDLASWVPGFWSHVGIYDKASNTVIESRPIEGGVWHYPLSDWFFPSRTYVRARRINTSQAVKDAAVAFASAQAGSWSPFDLFSIFIPPFLGMKNQDNSDGLGWYCSELIWAAYLCGSNGSVNLDMDAFAVSPEEIADSSWVQIVVGEHMETGPPPTVYQGAGVLYGEALCPVNLLITDPDGLVLSKSVNAIPGAVYMELDFDHDGDLDDAFMILERKMGGYSIGVIPEPNVLPTDTYSLEAVINSQRMILAENVQIQDIPTQPYKVKSKLCYSDFDDGGDVDFVDYAIFASHWLATDCNYPNWCEGTDLDYSGTVDFNDITIFTNDWLWKKIPADIDFDGDVDFVDYAVLALHWLDTGCVEPTWCFGADINKSGSVDLFDLAELAEHWLVGR